ncbi:MAG TPA: peptidoglycan DD-metalloendopeptidase family protein [Allosphingosinicella sp.]|jgi:murein DD-endopeptidase MepM/ murein hydrolase activator NlpD
MNKTRGQSRLYQFTSIEPGSGGAAVLSRPGLSGRGGPVRTFGARSTEIRQPRIDLVVDLGVRIGSREWFRGAATCLSLCTAAWWLGPTFDPIPAAAAAPLPERQWKEARSLGIAPLALGADTGRRFVPTAAVQTLIDTPERPTLQLVAAIGEGDGFVRALERAGVAPAEADEAARLIASALPLEQLKPGTAMNLTLGRRATRNIARPLDSLSLRARFDLKLSLKRSGKSLALTKTVIAIDDTPLRIQGFVGDSLYRSARAAGAPARAVEAYIRALASQIGIESLAADDRFDIILEHRRAATGEAETGKLLFAGLDRASGKDLQLLEWGEDGRTQWYEASGVGRETGLLTRPVPGMVSSNFGMRRHPILGYSRMHKGMDFRAGYGTPILAATDGRVAAAGWAGGYGQQVRIAHGGGLLTSYSHMSRIVAKPGSKVRQGEVIGYVGSTGLSTGPHLHYELYKDGVAVNPASVKFVTRSQLSGEDLTGFRSRLKSLLAVKPGATRLADKAKKKPKA